MIPPPVRDVLPLGLTIAFLLMLFQGAGWGRSPKTWVRPVLGIAFAAALGSLPWATPGHIDWKPVAFAAAACLAAFASPRLDLARGTRWLAGRFAPVPFGLATAALVFYQWGSLRAVAIFRDEAAYVLQSGLFARLRWAAEPPPIPAFFEQMHVLVTPVFAAKYPPGHALVLAAGTALGLPGLVPLLLAGGTGALVFAFARRVGDPWIGLLTWVLWSTSGTVLRFLPSYFSEATTGILWLGAWWMLLEWKRDHRTRWLCGVAAAIGWGAITRPFTMFLFAIPVGLVILVEVARRKGAWKDLAAGLAVGTSILAILPLWSVRTTGDWRTTPLQLYTSLYMPWDVPGFRPVSSTATRALPPVLDRVRVEMIANRERHVFARLPSIAWHTAIRIVREAWVSPGLSLVLFFLIGLIVIPAVAWTGLASAFLLFAGYLFYWWHWTLYFLELQPVLAFVTAAGVAAVFRALRPDSRAARSSAAGWPLLLVAIGVLVVRKEPIAYWRTARLEHSSYQRQFLTAVESIRDRRAVVFVRYAPDRDYYLHRSSVANGPEGRNARVWIVHDRAAENEALLRLAPERTPYLYDEKTNTLSRLERKS